LVGGSAAASGIIGPMQPHHHPGTAAGALRLALRPDLGGCIAGLWRDGLPVLRSAEPSTLAASRPSGCYPLVPYSNRLGYRRFRWLGQDHTTQPNFDDSPHSVHGVAWQRPWTVLSASRRHRGRAGLHPCRRCALAVRLRGAPALRARARCLTVSLAFTNRADQPQPVGLGWHPYFPKRTRSRLHIELSDRWESDATGLPTRKVPQPGIDGDVAHLAFDHCFEGWQGAARIRDEKLSLRLTASVPYLVVFTPATRDYFCVEPVSHVSNAIHMADPLAHGLRSVLPGGSTDAWMKLEVAAI
jgi:aldose 1-epimerase